MLGLRGLSRLVVLSLPLLLAGAASAQVKIGIVDAQGALAATAEVKKAQADLEAKFKKRNADYQQLQKELQAIQAQLSLGDKLTPQAQNDLSVQSTRKQRELQRVGEDLQADVDRESNDILTKTSQKLRQVISKLAADKGLDVVLDVADTVFFKPALDITKEATAAYDLANPVK
jgi:outer membrane protein